MLPTDGARVFVTPVDLGLGGDFLAEDDQLDLEAVAQRFADNHNDDTGGGD